MNLKRTPEKEHAFLAVLAETGNVTKSAAAIGCGRSAVYEWYRNDPTFAARWDQAIKVAVLGMEDEVKRRAFEGVQEPLTHQGQFTYEYERDETGAVIFDEIEVEREVISKRGKEIKTEIIRQPRLKMDGGQPRVATVTKYSDTLAIFLLKAHDPKYRENQRVELSGPEGGPIEMSQTQRAAKLAGLVERIKARVQRQPADDGTDLV